MLELAHRVGGLQRWICPALGAGLLRQCGARMPRHGMHVQAAARLCIRSRLQCSAIAASAAMPDETNGPNSQSGRGDQSAASSSARELSSAQSDTESLPETFCIIESRESVRDFAKLQLDEISANISARRNKIFLLMEEVRRLRIQQRIKGGERTKEEELGEEKYPSALPFLPPLTDATLGGYFQFYVVAVGAIILFGGLLSPILEVRLGIGGTSYEEFISGVHLPTQLAHVDPIVASFCGGAVGVLSTLMVIEMNNVRRQAELRCVYCGGTGYVACGACAGEGAVPASSPVPAAAGQAGARAPLISQSASGPVAAVGERCGSCSGTGKVACVGCLCTGKKVAREHDIRLDPFF